jgi:hypothetical protein
MVVTPDEVCRLRIGGLHSVSELIYVPSHDLTEMIADLPFSREVPSTIKREANSRKTVGLDTQ